MQSIVTLAILALGICRGTAGAAVVPAAILANATTAQLATFTEASILATTAIPTELVNVSTEAVTIHEALTTTARPWTELSVVEFFIKSIRGELIGARKCKKNHECGAGLKCNSLWNWCAPWDAPEWQEFANNCSSNADCGDLYYCLVGRCRLAGPRPCKADFECAAGIANVTFACIDTKDLEKHAILRQLGRAAASQSKVDLKPHKKHHHHEEEIESDEVAQFGATAEGDHLTHGKRCWAKCNLDADCSALRFPEVILKENFACCNGYCTRKQSCVSVPEIFRATTIASVVSAAAVKTI